MLRSIALLLIICQVASAQDTRPTDKFVENPLEAAPLRPEANPSATAENKASRDVAKVKDWQPKLAITLTTSPEGTSVARQVTRRVPMYVTEYEDRKNLRDERQPNVRVAVQKLTWREMTLSVVVPGSAQILCDEMNLTMKSSASGPAYSFECNGRLILQTSGSSISAESGSYSDGKLKLTNAKVQQSSMAMEAESLTLAMSVFGVSTLTAPVRDEDRDLRFTPGQPEPDRLFQPNDVNDARDKSVPAPRTPNFDRRDDWNPESERRSSPKDFDSQPAILRDTRDNLGR